MYHKAGYPGFVARLRERGPEYVNAVNWMSYQLAPRAQIFRRDSSNVTDFESLKSVMRYNSYKDDPVSAAVSLEILPQTVRCLYCFSSVRQQALAEQLQLLGQLPLHSAVGPACQLESGSSSLLEYIHKLEPVDRPERQLVSRPISKRL